MYEKTSNPDLDDLYYHSNTGEFSLQEEEVFEKHLTKLRNAADQFKNRNGDRVACITSRVRPWYSRAHNMIVFNK